MIANINGQLASLMEAMKDMKTNVDSLQKRSHIQGGVINDLQDKNNTQDRTINDLWKKNKKQDRIITKQGSTINDLQKRNKKQDNTIAKQGSTIDKQVATITQHSAAIECLEAQNEAQKGINEDLQMELWQEKARRKEDVECLIQVFSFHCPPPPLICI